MAENKLAGVIFLERTKFDIYVEGGESLISFPFPPNLLKDLEVTNKDQLGSQISTFIQTYIIYPAHVVILLAENVLFEKDILNSENKILDDSAIQFEIKKFLETIPFENVSSKSYTMQQGVRVIATNTDLYDTLRQALEKNGSVIDAVIPATLLADPNAAINGLNQELINSIFTNTESIKNQSLASPEEVALKIKKIEEEKNATLSLKGRNGRAILMGGLMLLLLIVFIIMVVKVNPFGTYTEKPASRTAPQQGAAPSPTAFPTIITVSPVSATGSAQTLTVKIINSSGTPANGFLLRSKLIESGFTVTELSNQTVQTIANTTITCNSSVLQPNRDKLVNVVKGMAKIVSIQDNQTLQPDCGITLGNIQ